MPKLDKTEQAAFNVLLEGVEHWVMALVRAALAPDPSQYREDVEARRANILRRIESLDK